MKNDKDQSSENDKKVPKQIWPFILFIGQEIWDQKKWFLIPFWLLLIIFSILIFASGGSHILPAIYMAF